MTDPRSAYMQAATRGATPVQLIVRLYEQIIEDLRQAIHALEEKQVELRTRRINHALLVLAHLQSQLDFLNGGQSARDLDRFYGTMRHNLMEAQLRVSKQILSQQITDLLEVRSGWLEVEQKQNPAGDGLSDAGVGSAGWKS